MPSVYLFTPTLGYDQDRRLAVVFVDNANNLYFAQQNAPNASDWFSEQLPGAGRSYPGYGRDLCMGSNKDGRLKIFYGAINSQAIIHNWQTWPNSTTWAGEAGLGGNASCIAVAQNSDGRLEIFYGGEFGNIWHNWQTKPNNGWAGEAKLEGNATGIVAGRRVMGAWRFSIPEKAGKTSGTTINRLPTQAGPGSRRFPGSRRVIARS